MDRTFHRLFILNKNCDDHHVFTFLLFVVPFKWFIFKHYLKVTKINDITTYLGAACFYDYRIHFPVKFYHKLVKWAGPRRYMPVPYKVTTRFRNVTNIRIRPRTYLKYNLNVLSNLWDDRVITYFSLEDATLRDWT